MPLESPSLSRNASREGVNRFQHTRCRALREVTIFDNLAWAFETGEACRAPRGSASPWLSQADSSALFQRCAGLHQAEAAADPRRAEDIAAEDCGEVRALKVWLFECDSVASSSFSLLESPLGHLGSLGSVGSWTILSSSSSPSITWWSPGMPSSGAGSSTASASAPASAAGALASCSAASVLAPASALGPRASAPHCLRVGLLRRAYAWRRSSSDLLATGRHSSEPHFSSLHLVKLIHIVLQELIDARPAR